MRTTETYLEPQCVVIELGMEQGIATGSPTFNGMGGESDWNSIS